MGVAELTEDHVDGLITCEDVVGVVTPLSTEWHKISIAITLSSSVCNSQCKKWREKEKTKKRQVEVEEEKRLKEIRSWMTVGVE